MARTVGNGGSRSRRSRRAAGVLVGLFVLLATFEVASRLALSVLASRLDEPVRTRAELFADQSARIMALLGGADDRLRLDPALGWSYTAGLAGADTLNAIGARSAHEYAPALPQGGLRVAAFGDSFVYGSGVPISESWAARWERSQATLEVINFGVGGYGVDQALIRHGLVKRAVPADVVLVGFAPVDLARVVNVYRRFRSSREFPLTKPRFLLDANGRLTPRPPPAGDSAALARIAAEPALVTAWGEHDHWYRPLVYESRWHDHLASVRLTAAIWHRVWTRYLDPDRLVSNGRFRPESEAFRIQLGLFNAFADSARAAGSLPVLLFLPSRTDVSQTMSGGSTVYQPLRDSAEAHGLAVLDAVEPLRAPPGPGSELFLADGHYAPAGNARIAEWLGQALPGVLDQWCGPGSGEARPCGRVRDWRAASARRD